MFKNLLAIAVGIIGGTLYFLSNSIDFYGLFSVVFGVAFLRATVIVLKHKLSLRNTGMFLLLFGMFAAGMIIGGEVGVLFFSLPLIIIALDLGILKNTVLFPK